MAVPNLIKSQMIKKYDELVEQLQLEARMIFYDRMMYDINDSLTSILAVCEVEPKEAIPKIKQYIHRINQSLNETKNYQNNSRGEKKFNITLVLKNLVRVIEENYKDVKLVRLISDIKAPVQGDQSKFEQLFLNVFVKMFSEGDNGDSEVLVELRQKDQDAMLTILKDNYALSKEALEQINKIKEDDFRGTVRVTSVGRGVEVIIKIPLQFRVINISKPLQKSTTPAPSKEIAQKKAKELKSKIRKIEPWDKARGSIATPKFAF